MVYSHCMGTGPEPVCGRELTLQETMSQTSVNIVLHFPFGLCAGTGPDLNQCE